MTRRQPAIGGAWRCISGGMRNSGVAPEAPSYIKSDGSHGGRVSSVKKAKGTDLE